ncbi:MAG: hypothetical protein ACPGGK_10580 [Pikeienuella sp.]
MRFVILFAAMLAVSACVVKTETDPGAMTVAPQGTVGAFAVSVGTVQGNAPYVETLGLKPQFYKGSVNYVPDASGSISGNVSNIGNVPLKTSVISSLQNSGMLTEGSALTLSASIVERQRVPDVGAKMRTVVLFTLSQNEKEVWRENIEATGYASFSESPLNPKRVRLATERSILQINEQLIKRLAELDPAALNNS